jgi:hypothetical protein
VREHEHERKVAAEEVLYRLVVDHFTTSVRTRLEREPNLLPDGERSREWRTKACSSFLAGQVGIAEAWLAEPPPRDRRLLISASASQLSTWFFPNPPSPIPPGGRTRRRARFRRRRRCSAR